MQNNINMIYWQMFFLTDYHFFNSKLAMIYISCSVLSDFHFHICIEIYEMLTIWYFSINDHIVWSNISSTETELQSMYLWQLMGFVLNTCSSIDSTPPFHIQIYNAIWKRPTGTCNDYRTVLGFFCLQYYLNKVELIDRLNYITIVSASLNFSTR